MGSTIVEGMGSLQPRPTYNYNNSYGSEQRYTSPSSSYRAPATYSQPQGGKGGYEAPPPRQQPMQQGGKGGYEAPPMRQQQNFGGMPTSPVSGYGGGGPRVPMDNPYSSRPKGNYVTNRGGMSYTDMDSGIEYASPSFAPRNYGSLMDMPSVADTPENRAAGQQYNDQLNQRFSSKGGVSPTPPRSSQLGNLYKPNKSGAGAALGRVPSFDPKNPQDDAIKDPKLRKAAKQLNKQAPPGERLAFINPKEEELLKAVGGSGMIAAGGIPSYKKGDVEALPPRDLRQETRDTLEAQIELAPDLYESEAQFRPQYANLERGIMLENLGLDPQMGLLDAFRQISSAQKGIQEDATRADINMIRDLGGELAEAQRPADPRAEALRQSIMGEAERGLATGDQDFSDIAEAQRDRLVNRVGDYQPLMDRASAGLEGGAEYDALVNEAQQARGTNPFDRVVANADSARGSNPFNEVNEQLRGRVDSNPYNEVTSRLQSKLDANPYAGLVRDAQEDYASGDGLTALEQRDLDQQVLAGAASRGMEDSAGTLAEQIGQRLSGNRQVRNQRRDALSQALGISDAYNRTATQDFTNALGLQSQYGRQSLGDLSAGLGQASAYDRDALSDYSTALGLQEGYSDRGLNRFTQALGQREDFGRRMEQDYAGALSGRMGLEAALMGDYERALTNQQAAQQQALSNAGVAYGMGNFDPLLALTGRSGTAPAMAQQGFGASGFALDSSPALFNPESSYAGSLYGQNYASEMDARTATAANKAGMFAGLMGGLGSLGGGLLAGRK